MEVKLIVPHISLNVFTIKILLHLKSSLPNDFALFEEKFIELDNINLKYSIQKIK